MIPPFRPTKVLPVSSVDGRASAEKLVSTMLPTVTLLPLNESVLPFAIATVALLPI